jgi:hypothetical protein
MTPAPFGSLAELFTDEETVYDLDQHMEFKNLKSGKDTRSLNIYPRTYGRENKRTITYTLEHNSKLRDVNILPYSSNHLPRKLTDKNYTYIREESGVIYEEIDFFQ